MIRAPDARADSLVEVAIPLIRERVEQRRALPAPEVYEKWIQAIIAAGEKALAEFERVAADRS